VKDIETEVQSIRIWKSLKNRAQRRAAKKGMDLSEYINHLLLQDLQAADDVPVDMRFVIMRSYLIQRFLEKALEIIAMDGPREDICLETGRRIIAEDAVWKSDYEVFIGAAYDASGVQRKAEINPLLNKSLKRLLNARVSGTTHSSRPSMFTRTSGFIYRAPSENDDPADDEPLDDEPNTNED
jgi:antitoxin component of RelBE/YafQ-DinJ toxin-antitoxin module